MQIHPTQLWTAPSPDALALAAAKAEQWLADAGLMGNDAAPYLVPLAQALVVPLAWDFEHAGWFFQGLRKPDGSCDAIRACHDGIVLNVDAQRFNEARAAMLQTPEASTQTFLELLLQGHTPKAHLENLGDAAFMANSPFHVGVEDGLRVGGLEVAPFHQAIAKVMNGESFISSRQSGSWARPYGEIPSRVKLLEFHMGHDPHPEARKQIANRLLRDIEHALSNRQHRLCSRLNPRALEKAQALNAPSLRVTHWLSMGHVDYRHQAIDAAGGVLAQLIETHWKQEQAGIPDNKEAQSHARRGLAGIQDITALIDAGKPWHAEASAWLASQARPYFETGEAFEAELVRGFRRLSQPQHRATKQVLLEPPLDKPFLPPTDEKPFSPHCPATLLVFLAGTLEKPDLPCGDDEWKKTLYFFDRARLAHVEGNGFRPGNPLVNARFVPLARDYVAFLKHMRIDRPRAWIIQHTDCWERFQPALDDAIRWLEEAFSLQPKEALEALWPHLRWTQWRDLDDTLHRFHREAIECLLAQRIGDEDVDDLPALWDPRMPTRFEAERVTFKALTHPTALLLEGDDLGHCVGGYTEHCFSGRSRIYALTDTKTGDRATLELQQKNGAVTSSQLQGPRNTIPGARFSAATHAFLSKVNAENSPQDPWPSLPTPPEWETQDVWRDPDFQARARQWLLKTHGQYVRPLVNRKPLPMAECETQAA